MANERERRIVLLGPPKAGTTTLIATLVRALERNAHGFSRSERFIFDAEPDRGEGRQALAALSKDYVLGALGSAESHESIAEYELLLEAPPAFWTGLARRNPAAATRFRVILTDTPGQTLLTPRGVASDNLTTLEETLARAHGLIVVWPIDRVADRMTANDASAGWAAALAALAAKGKAAFPKLEVMVVAFSCFDRELAAAGADAAEAALDGAYVRHAIAASLRRNDVLKNAIASMALWVRDLDLMAVSSFGVIKGYGETNWDIGSGRVLIDGSGGGKLGDLVKGARKPALPAELDEMWLPLFVADPVIRCALGKRHGLMTPARKLLAAA